MKYFIKFVISLLLFTIYHCTLCRDGSYCPGLSTCCLTPRGVGCCPYINAVCCGDGIHCCPNGYVCGTRGACYRQDGSKSEESKKIEWKSNINSELEIDYILGFCVGDNKIDESFKEMLISCKNNKNDNCKIALLYLINQGFVRSIDCFDRINALIKEL